MSINDVWVIIKGMFMLVNGCDSLSFKLHAQNMVFFSSGYFASKLLLHSRQSCSYHASTIILFPVSNNPNIYGIARTLRAWLLRRVGQLNLLKTATKTMKTMKFPAVDVTVLFVNKLWLCLAQPFPAGNSRHVCSSSGCSLTLRLHTSQ